MPVAKIGKALRYSLIADGFDRFWSYRHCAGGSGLPSLLNVRYRNGAEQVLSIRMLRMVQHSISWADLHELADKHHRYPVADALHHRHIMGNKQIAEPIALTQIFQQRQHLRLY